MKYSLLTLTSMAVLSLSAGAALAGNYGNGDGAKGEHKGGWVQQLDTNGDGDISKAEFDAHHAKKFEKMDADGNGVVSKDELKASKAKMKEKFKEMREKRQKNKADSE